MAINPGLSGISLNWLRSFEVAARLLSYKEAGAELGVTLAAVSYNVKLLEAELRVHLFYREKFRPLRLTPAGARFADVVRMALADVEGGLAELQGHKRLARASTTSRRR